MIRAAMVGTTGKKWHIALNELVVYCGMKPSWIDDEEKELSEIMYLCENCRVRYPNQDKPALTLNEGGKVDKEVDETYEAYMADVGAEHLAKRRLSAPLDDALPTEAIAQPE